MTLKNNRAPLLFYFKLCASIRNHWCIETWVSPETRNFGQIRRFLEPCDLEIWRMTLKNNRAPLLWYFKLCASFRSHWWIQTGVTVRKRSIYRARHLFFPQLGSRTTIKQYGLVRNRNLLGQDDNIHPFSIKKSGRTVSVYLSLFQDYCVWRTLSHNKSLVFFCRGCDFSFLSILTSHGPGIHFKGYKNV